MNVVVRNILEAARAGKPRHVGMISISLLVSLAVHGILLSLSLGSTTPLAASALSTSKLPSQPFVYIVLPPPAEATPQSPSAPLPSIAAQIQKPNAQEPSAIPISTPEELYFRGKELERRPSPVGSLAFTPPLMGIETKEIEVNVRVFVNEYGTVDFVRVEGDSPGSEFTDPITDTLKKSRFIPGQLNGENVKSQILLGWKFVTQGQ